MSINSVQDNLLPQFTKVEKIQMVLKKTAKLYFEKPLYYLFYSSLALMMILLAAGRKLSWEFYVMMILLSISQYPKLTFDITKKIKEGKFATVKTKTKQGALPPKEK